MKSHPIKDLLTGELFIPKRINQRFSNPFNRIKYYNDKANEFRHSSAWVNKPLHSNHKILVELMLGKQDAEFHKEFLKGKGICFGVFSHTQKYGEEFHPAIYKFIIITMPNNVIKIIRND